MNTHSERNLAPLGGESSERIKMISSGIGESRQLAAEFFKKISPNEIHVWHVNLPGRAKNRSVASHGALRQILASYLGEKPESLQFSVDKKGKPFLKNNELHFNLSHSGEYALIAVAWDRPVGVDIEKIKKRDKTEEIAKRFFNPKEADALEALPKDEKMKFFYELWTRKEAVSKVLGEGIFRAISTQNISADISVKNLDVAIDYAAAVAAPGSDWNIFYFCYNH